MNILLWGLLTLCYFSGNFKFKGEDCSVSTSSSVCTIAPLGTLSSHRTFSLYVHSPANISRCLSLFSSFLFWSSQSTFQEARLRDPKHYKLLQAFDKIGLKAIDTEEGWLRNPEHHLVKMIKAAVGRLPEKLQFAFFGFSLFTNPFTAEAAAAVLGAKDTWELKRSFAAGLQQRCLIDFDPVSGRFSMQPLLSQFGREACSGRNKKIFHQRFSFYFLDLLQVEVLQVSVYRAKSIFFVQFLQMEFPHLCTALKSAETLNTAQVNYFRTFSASAIYPLAQLFRSEAIPFFHRCIRVAKMENDREWLYSSLIAELAITLLTDEASASQHAKTLLNFLEQERISNSKDKDTVNLFRVMALGLVLELDDDSKHFEQVLETVSREILTTPLATDSSANCLHVRLFAIAFLHQADWLFDWHRTLSLFFTALEKLVHCSAPSEGVFLCVLILAHKLSGFFATAALPPPLGICTDAMLDNVLLLEVCDLSTSLHLMQNNLSVHLFDGQQRSFFGDLHRPIMDFVVAGCFMRHPQLYLVPFYGLSFPNKFLMDSTTRLTSLCNTGAATFMTNIASASTAEKAYFYSVQQVSPFFFNPPSKESFQGQIRACWKEENKLSTISRSFALTKKPVGIMTRYPKINGSHFGLSPSKMSELGGNFV